MSLAVRKSPVLLILLASGLLNAEPSRKAVLVGINNYLPSTEMQKALRAAKSEFPAYPRIPVQGKFERGGYDPLHGSEADVDVMKALLVERFQFRDSDVITLKGQHATADAILWTLQQALVDDAKPGDIRVFYYSGHGSTMYNKSSREIDHRDQTIVPADNWRGTPDIRDKELARIFRRAANKGVRLTIIADSCHSGSIARGPMARGRTARQLPAPPDSYFVDDPPEVNDKGKPVPEAEDLGALVISAAQRDETAEEYNTPEGVHGALTWALLRVIRTSAAGERVHQIQNRVQAFLRADSLRQTPVIVGRDRLERALLGDPADPTSGVQVAIESVAPNGRILVAAGTAAGLFPGAKLGRPGLAGKPRDVIAEVTGSREVSRSDARITRGDPQELRPGDLLEVRDWSFPSTTRLSVFVPPAIAPQSLDRLHTEIDKLRGKVDLIDDPSARDATHVMSWNGAAWVIEPSSGEAAAVDLGPAPAAPAILSALAGSPGAKLSVLLPPHTGVAAALANAASSPSGAGIRFSSDSSTAQFGIFGRFNSGTLEYALLQREWTAERAAKARSRSQTPAGPSLPLRSDWISSVSAEDAARSLFASAIAMARVRSWLNLTSPEPPGSGGFPYHLVLRNMATGADLTRSEVRKGEEYQPVLKADPSLLAALHAKGRLQRRWVYVFTIDEHGKSELLFGERNEGNHLPLPVSDDDQRPQPMREIVLSGLGFRIDDPLGTDTYFLLATENELPDPLVLQFNGVQTRGRPATSTDELTNLIQSTNGQTRSAKPIVAPATWSLEKLTLTSLPAQ